MKKSSTFLSALAIICTASAFEGNLEEHQHNERKLFFSSTTKGYFDKYLSIHNRCCGDSHDECKCPVRDLTWFGIKSKWDKSCETTILRKSSIAALASANDDFSTLVSLLDSADLVGTLSKDSADGKGFTVFAPTNAAFEKLGDVDLTEDQIKQVLLYHVVAGTVPSDQLSDGQVITTLNGQDLSVNTQGGVTLNGDVSVTGADNFASNGVVHIIDKVLVPELN
ncbi:hypothetical protein HJC23_010089 [Cyclotella cryptica]|uniref:FAS1 domain-containing protein n=1 Tax=Cyclotella cryptica TaxID=29204 RepID=A0ABD3Q556_9STRA|eukprot:CCRYP_009083-RA/>CCRYP_009083-RA protein AED:0.12 eAED:0.12 QI:0/-1/0/1/-1/1/1/0/223